MDTSKAFEEAESQGRKRGLVRMAAMLSRLGGRGYQVDEDRDVYGSVEVDFDTDPDSDFDGDERRSQPADALDAHSSRQ